MLEDPIRCPCFEKMVALQLVWHLWASLPSPWLATAAGFSSFGGFIWLCLAGSYGPGKLVSWLICHVLLPTLAFARRGAAPGEGAAAVWFHWATGITHHPREKWMDFCLWI